MVLRILDWLRSWRTKVHVISNIRQEFSLFFNHAVLTSFQALSDTPDPLLLLLDETLPSVPPHNLAPGIALIFEFNSRAPGWEPGFLRNTTPFGGALEILDDDKLDREWIVRNVLGAMSAGFGLRVILDIHPVFTTIIILAGWAAKTAVAGLVSRWVGGDEMTGEAWLAYSIP